MLRAVIKVLSLALQVRQFYTAPTLVRALEAQDDHFVTDHDRSSLRILGTVGEPINPRAWLWFFKASAFCPRCPRASVLMTLCCYPDALLGQAQHGLSCQGVSQPSLPLTRCSQGRHEYHSGKRDIM